MPRSHPRLPRGRPPLPPAARLGAVLKFRLTPSEAAAVRAAAALSGISVAQYCRLAVTSVPPPPAVPPVNRRLWTALAQVGGNLNQALHALHTGTLIPTFAAILVELRSLLQETRALLLAPPPDDSSNS